MVTGQETGFHKLPADFEYLFLHVLIHRDLNNVGRKDVTF